MNYLTVRNRIIDKPIIEILQEVRNQTGKLSTIENKYEYIRVTCPFHKGGAERRASCSVYTGTEDLEQGYFHCFTCHEKGSFSKFIGGCFNESEQFGEQWLLDNFESSYLESSLDLEPIDLTEKVKLKNEILDDKILEGLEGYNEYFKKRKISEEIAEKFELGYNSKTREVIFPLRDEKGNLVGLTKRKTDYKKYELPKLVYKPIYLLYYIINNGIKEVYVCESQINALYLWSLGYPAIALLGTGSKYQYNLLNKSGILFYHLCFDGDEAGDKGIKNFIENINRNSIIDVIQLPRGKDINDLDEGEINILIHKH